MVQLIASIKKTGYKVIKERPITIVLIAPSRKRNSLWSFIFDTSFPINAAWLAPNPGRNAVKGAAIIEAKLDFAKDFLFNLIFFNFVIFCLGIFVFCFMLIMRLLAPNKPVKRGRSGSFILRLRDAIPRNPAKRKMINAQIFF